MELTFFLKKIPSGEAGAQRFSKPVGSLTPPDLIFLGVELETAKSPGTCPS
jgi:hypothetical protein